LARWLHPSDNIKVKNVISHPIRLNRVVFCGQLSPPVPTVLIYSNNYAIILLFKKEAGENPARARRREVPQFPLSALTDAANQ